MTARQVSKHFCLPAVHSEQIRSSRHIYVQKCTAHQEIGSFGGNVFSQLRQALRCYDAREPTFAASAHEIGHRPKRKLPGLVGYLPGRSGREKLRFVMAAMDERLRALGFTWRDAVNTQAYTVHDIGAMIGEEIVATGAAGGGVTWHYCRPPVIDIEYEMDVRGAASEIML